MGNKSVESVENEVDDIAGSDRIKLESIWPILCSYLIIKCHRVVWEKQIQSHSWASLPREHKLNKKNPRSSKSNACGFCQNVQSFGAILISTCTSSSLFSLV